MAKAKKTDNHDPAAKLALRRHFLRRYHADAPPNVLDCCQGGGRLWCQLREEFPIVGYWGLDLKPKAGRLSLDSMRVLGQPGWPQDVIDIDTYGSPWKHWLAMLPNVMRPVTVFLTIGQWQMGTDSVILESLGLGRLRVPPGIAVSLHDMAVSYCLTRCCDYGNIIVEAVEAVSSGHARYVGVRLEKAGPESQRLPDPRHTQPEKEVGACPRSIVARNAGGGTRTLDWRVAWGFTSSRR